MNITISLSEIINTACKLKTKEEKIAFLQKNNSKALRNIFKLMYDKSLELTIPSVTPPYTPSEYPDSHGLLYRETRKLKYFVKGHGGDNINKIRREALFIQMLETVDKDDAVLLTKVIKQKPLPGLPAAVVREALGDFIPDSRGSKKKDEQA